VRQTATQSLSEARDGVRECLDNARPQVNEGFAHFKQQVLEDYQSTSQDMKDAFGPSEAPALGVVRGAVGTAAGVVAAVRLVPIRATRLVAHSVAAVAGKDVPCVDADPPAEMHSSDFGDVTEFERLKEQVKHDFQSTRADVSAAFSCILGQANPADPESPPSDPADQAASTGEPVTEQSNPQPEQHPTPDLKTKIPCVVSAVVGGSAAVCLLPLRVARFAVANIANFAGSRTEANQYGIQEAPDTSDQDCPHAAQSTT